jgi:hypothetical protein
MFRRFCALPQKLDALIELVLQKISNVSLEDRNEADNF